MVEEQGRVKSTLPSVVEDLADKNNLHAGACMSGKREQWVWRDRRTSHNV